MRRDITLAEYLLWELEQEEKEKTMDAQKHHENPNTYADTWEDCLVVLEEGATENASHAEHWGGKEGDTMIAFSDYTDGPVTRVRYFGDDAIVRNVSAAELRLKPATDGSFVVTEHHAGEGYSDCAIMKNEADLGDGINAASVEKWVPKEKIAELFPIGRRFTLVPVQFA